MFRGASIGRTWRRAWNPAFSASTPARWNSTTLTPVTSVPNLASLLVNERSAKEKVAETVLVTGANGCVGQHIISLLQQHDAENLKSIRVFDCNPYDKSLEYPNVVPVEIHVGNLRNVKDVEKVVNGVDTVIHAGSLISVGAFADIRGMRETNVGGTKNIVDACKKYGVPKLVYTGSLEVAIGLPAIYDGTESEVTVPPPDGKFLLTGYPETKYLAERCVLENHGATVANGSTLSSLVLRLTMIYGDLDNHVVTTSLKRAAGTKTRLPRIKLRSDLLQATYAGNAAWAHVCALKSLRARPEAVGGQAYFVTDDTKLQPMFNFLASFLEPCGYEFASYELPFNAVCSLVGLQETVAKMVRPWKEIEMTESVHGLKFLDHIHFFNSALARRNLGYVPLYDREESFRRSLSFYVDLSKELKAKEPEEPATI